MTEKQGTGSSLEVDSLMLIMWIILISGFYQLVTNAQAREQAVVQETAVTARCYEAVGSVNVRQGHGTSYPLTRTLSRGNKVTVTEIQGGWGKVGQNEWIFISLVRSCQ